MIRLIPIEKQLTETRKQFTDRDLPALWEKVRQNKCEHIDLSYNEAEIQHLRVPSRGLEQVRYLYLYDSNIQKITIEGNLPNLEILHLGKNQLTEFRLPRGFERLEHLRLDNNDLTHFELEDYRQLRDMRSLFLQKNKLENIPPEIWSEDENCWREVREYLRAAASGVIINNEAKVIWFGNGEAGKTTLSHQLRHQFFKSFERTHGIQIKNWTISYSDLKPAMKSKIADAIAEAEEQYGEILAEPEQLHLKLWDFGGQEYYHATHRLFLNNNAMYLLIWDVKTDTQFEHEQDASRNTYPRSYWRHNIEYYADRDKVVLEVQNKAEGNAHINHANRQYKVEMRQENNEEEYLWDVKKLEGAILENLHELTYLGQTFPEVYDHIRQLLRKEKAHFLSLSDYQAFCRQNDTTAGKENLMQDPAQIQLLTEFLHDTGALICYHYKKHYSKRLQNYVFIKPIWVTENIYRILDEGLLQEGEYKGEFDRAHVAEKTKNTGLLPEDWIELMKQFQLIFEIERMGKPYFIVPQYLPSKCTNPSAMRMTFRGRQMRHCFTLSFPKFLPKSHFLQFIADHGSSNIDYLYWKNGLLFFHNELTVFAKCNYSAQKISIGVGAGSALTQTVAELFQWFLQNDKISPDTEISLDGTCFIPIAELRNYHRQNISTPFLYKNAKHRVGDYWFLFGMSK